MSKNPLVLYHAHCADGFGAAFSAWLKLGDAAEYQPIQHGESLNRKEDIEGRDVYILDFSFSKHHMDFIFENAAKVVWLDHHKTAFEMWCGSFVPGGEFSQFGEHDIILNNNRSGARLAWEYFHPITNTPLLIKHIDDYDRWVFSLNGTKEYSLALWSNTPWDFEQWAEFNDMHSHVENPEYQIFLEEGAAIHRAHNQNVEATIEVATIPCTLMVRANDDYTEASGLSANCLPQLASEVGHQLANKSGTYGLVWFLHKDGVAQCSLRSNGDYDVSIIAKSFGGGGHKNAAGFRVSLPVLLSFIDL